MKNKEEKNANDYDDDDDYEDEIDVVSIGVPQRGQVVRDSAEFPAQPGRGAEAEHKKKTRRRRMNESRSSKERRGTKEG